MMCEREVKGYELGCYGDGAFGADHCTQKVIEIASDEGVSFSPEDEETPLESCTAVHVGEPEEYKKENYEGDDDQL